MRRVIVHTGNGRGKTTAALGIVLRAIGHGQRAAVIHFIKSAPSGEYEPLKNLGVSIEISGCGFTPKPESPDYDRHCSAAERGMTLAEGFVHQGIDCLILDEICGAIAAGLVPEDRVLGLIDALHDHQVLVCTGRRASPRLVDAADTVSEIGNVKHALSDGIPAQEGVEL